MSINSILFQSTYGVREPVLLNLGKTTGSNYDNLADYLAQESSASTTAVSDKVDLALDKVKDKMVSELASITAEAIGDYPELADDYVLAVIDTGDSRSVRVWSREEIIELGGGTEEEKAQRREQLAANPLLFYDSAELLPDTTATQGAAALAEKADAFLKTNDKLLTLLGKYGYNPFSDETAEA
jgi:hypothetical protein